MYTGAGFDPASLQILQRLDDLEVFVRKSHTPDSTESEKFTPRPEEAVDRTRLLPCTTDQVLKWDIFRHLHVGDHLDGPAYVHANLSSSQATASPPTFGLDDLESHRVNTLLDSFFNYVHVKNPVLDEQHTRKLVLQVCMHGIDWTADACLALLVCALGTIATPFDSQYHTRESEAYRTAESFFLAAKKRLGMVLAESSLLEAQCLFLAGVYCMHTFSRLPAWRYFMQSLTCCQIFESLKLFNQDDSAIDEAKCRSVAAEQAIYWSAWKSEREVHTELGLPGHIFAEFDIEGYPPFFPTPPDHARNVPSKTPAAMEEREKSSWYFYLSEISLLRLRRRITKEIVDFKPGGAETFLESLATCVPDQIEQIDDWVSALPEQMSINAPPDNDEICRFVLRGHLINVYEILYWPYVESAIRMGPEFFSAAVLMNLATKGLQTHVDRITVNRRGFRHRHHGTFSMIQSCTRSAFVLLAAATALAARSPEQIHTIPQPYHLPPDWETAVEDVIQLNKDWQNDAQDLVTIIAVLDKLWYRWKLLSRELWNH